MCMCKIFHWYNFTVINHKRQTYFWVFSVYFVIIYRFVIYRQIAVLVYEQENTEAKHFFPFLKKSC